MHPTFVASMTHLISETDARGHTVRMLRPPRRIVSLVPSLTELLSNLGLTNEVVGLTRFCISPTGWKAEKQIVGGTKQVNRDRIRVLEPDLVLANREENTREDVEAIGAIAPVYVTDVAPVPAAVDMIRGVGRLTGRASAARELAQTIEERFAALPSSTPLSTAYLIWQRPYMTVGSDTFIHDVMARVGLVNVFSDRQRYPKVTVADIAARSPQLVLLSSEPFPFQATHAAALQPRIPGAYIRLVDGTAFSWYGSRLRTTPAYLRNLRSELSAAVGELPNG